MSVINTIRFDVDSSGVKLAKDVQDKIFSICRYALNPSLNKIIEESEEGMPRFEQIILDLGGMSYASLDSQLIPKLLAAFESQLALVQDPKIAVSKHDLIEEMKVFLEKGVRHWATTHLPDVDASINLLIKDYWADLFSFLRQTRHQEAVIGRLVSQLHRITLRKIIEKIRPNDADFILGFIQDVIDIKNDSEDKFGEVKVETELIQLVLLDLVKNYGSYFNRKMFVRSQLIGLSMTFKKDYYELLRLFSSVISNDSIPFLWRSTLPALVADLINDTIHLVPESTETIQNCNWKPLQIGKITKDEKNTLESYWELWIRNYAGEMANDLKKSVTTLGHVDWIVRELGDEKTQDLMSILEPKEYQNIITLKRGTLKSGLFQERYAYKHTDLQFELNRLILGFLLIESGSRFNKKQFLKYQVIGLARAINIHFIEALRLLTKGLSINMDSQRTSTLITLLAEIENEQSVVEYKAKDLRQNEIPEELKMMILFPDQFQSDALIVKDKIRLFKKFLAESKTKRDALDLILTNQEIVSFVVHSWDSEFFNFIIEVLVNEKLKLRGTEASEFINKVKDQSRKPSFIFVKTLLLKELITFKKLDRNRVDKYNLESTDPKGGSLVFRYFSELIKKDDGGGESIKNSIKNPEQIENLVLQIELFSKIRVDESGLPSHLGVSEILFERVLKKAILSESNLKQLVIQLSKGGWKILIEYLSTDLHRKLVKALYSLHTKKDVSFPEFGGLGWQNSKRLIDIIIISKQQLIQNPHKQLLKSKVEELFWKDESDERKESQQVDLAAKKHELLSELENVLQTGRMASSSLLPQLVEAIFIWHQKGLLSYKTTVKNAILSDRTARQISNLFGEKILLRFLQVYIGGPFNYFMSMSKDAEYLLTMGLVESKAKITNEYIWSSRLLFAQRSDASKVLLSKLILSHFRRLSNDSQSRMKAISSEFTLEILKVKKEINPVSLRRNVDKLLRSLKKDEPEVVEEIVVTTTEEIEVPISIHNSGIALLWPYLSLLFTKADLLNEDKTFKDVTARKKGVWLLQFLGSGVEEEPEYLATFSKLLCGMPLEVSLGIPIPLEEELKELAESMLEGVIQNWDRLENTSIEGLRNTFLLRKGMLSTDGSDWTLQVDRKGVDVLLQYLPWAISNIKLPWMERVIYVSWH